MDIDLRQVRYFVAVAEHLHFGRAAAVLHIAQPVLSRQIKALERDIGAELLRRDRRTVRLTPAGRQFLGDARHLLAAADGARRRVARTVPGAHQVTVGFRWGMAVTSIVREFTAAHPGVTLAMRQLRRDQQESAVLDGRADAAFVRPPLSGDGLQLTFLYREPRFAVMSKGHPLASRSQVRYADLAGAPPHGQASAVELIDGAIEEWLETVAQGGRPVLVPEPATAFYTRPDVSYVPVSDVPQGEVWLAVAAAESSALVADFARIAAASAARRTAELLAGAARGR